MEDWRPWMPEGRGGGLPIAALTKLPAGQTQVSLDRYVSLLIRRMQELVDKEIEDHGLDPLMTAEEELRMEDLFPSRETLARTLVTEGAWFRSQMIPIWQWPQKVKPLTDREEAMELRELMEEMTLREALDAMYPAQRSY
jgi:hypothetical protein